MYVGNKTDKEKRNYILASLFLTFFFFFVELGAKEWVWQSELKICSLPSKGFN